jgi:hypothetical protein
MVWLALSLPVSVLCFVALAVAEALCIRFSGSGLVPWLRHRSGRSLSTTAMEGLSVAVSPDKHLELEQRDTESLLRDDEEAGAPPTRGHRGIDLDAGTALIRIRRTEGR